MSVANSPFEWLDDQTVVREATAYRVSSDLLVSFNSMKSANDAQAFGFCLYDMDDYFFETGFLFASLDGAKSEILSWVQD